ncbi:hypothetical protein [Oceanobacillus massiliensis]|uniref:hypothetical protein n=1 Tax=Oceanobacillus massiliensis TaxID=1465765 RepID=UPI003015ECDA
MKKKSGFTKTGYSRSLCCCGHFKYCDIPRLLIENDWILSFEEGGFKQITEERVIITVESKDMDSTYS